MYLGIELGSTRIKAVLLNDRHIPVASGSDTWQAAYENGVWTYDLKDAVAGLKAALHHMGPCETVRAAGISGMMHGYLAFDKDWNLLVPFRTWQNTMTAEAAAELTKLFGFNVPQRWSIAHLYQAFLRKEPHVPQIAHITTLAGYIHFLLTGVNAIGVGEASGMFPIDSKTLTYDRTMLDKLSEKQLPWKVEDLLPAVLPAGAPAGTLTEAGAALLGGLLPVGTPFAPPEGDAGTGMTATNAVAPGTGNISAGTSIFSMVVLDRPLSAVYEEIDMVTTPSGKPVAMVHCNNCTNDTNAWAAVLKEAAQLFGAAPTDQELYTRLYECSLQADADCGGILVCNYLAGEGITHMDSGRPLVLRRPGSRFTLANFFRAQLYSTMVTLKLGMEILEKEQVTIDRLTGHGGLFKTPVVGQTYMAAACGAPVTVMETAGEGGPYGMALLAAYMCNRQQDESLEDYLAGQVFADAKTVTLQPEPAITEGFARYTEAFRKLLEVEQTAITVI